MNGMAWRGEFPGDLAHLGDVRRLAKALLQDSQVRDDAIMCLMELAANAVLHTRSANGVFTVGIWSAGDTAARVAVQDSGGWDEPVVRQPGQEDLAESGRGLAIVVALAERLGVAGDEGGRVVWADLSCDQGGDPPWESPWEEVPLLEPACDRCRPAAGPKMIYTAVPS
ncbi:ATP-binding protein [Nonomuraea sp. NPDC004580]|uniref:ATP-binding protein n=1 Tax=Nonomuraea sp. NPDC004580 TaxID=3154552 RepID=UPI0033A52765